MEKPVSVKATKQTHPGYRKLARALLLLAEQQQAAPRPKPKRSADRKAS